MAGKTAKIPGIPTPLHNADSVRMSQFARDLVWSRQADLPIYFRPAMEADLGAAWAQGEMPKPFMPEPLREKSFRQHAQSFAHRTASLDWSGILKPDHGRLSDQGITYVYRVEPTKEDIQAGRAVVLKNAEGQDCLAVAADGGVPITSVVPFDTWWLKAADPYTKAEASQLVLRPRPVGEAWSLGGEPPHGAGQRLIMAEPICYPAGMDPRTGEFNVWWRLKEQMPVPDPASSMEHPAVKLFLCHLDYLADGEAEVAAALWNRYCHMLQNPHQKTAWLACYVSEVEGGRRQGKTFVLYLMSAIWRAMGSVIGGSQLFDRWTYAIDFKVYVGVNEMPRLDRAENQTRFKSLITDATYTSERKFEGVDPYAPNFINFDITSNDPKCWDVLSEPERALIVRCSSRRKERAYYDQLETLLHPENLSALMGAMLRYPLPASWDHRAPAYQSKGVAALAEEQRDPVEALVEELIDQRQAPFDRDLGTVNAVIERLRTLYPNRTAALRITDKGFGKALKRLGAVKHEFKVYEDRAPVWKARPYIWRNTAGWLNAKGEQVRLHMETSVRLTASTGVTPQASHTTPPEVEPGAVALEEAES